MTSGLRRSGCRWSGTATTAGRAVVAAALVIAALTGCTGADPSEAPRIASTTTTTTAGASGVASPPAVSLPSAADLAAVTAVLRARAAAVVSGDVQAYAGRVADSSSAQGRRQLAAFGAARALRVTRLSLGAVTVDPMSAATDFDSLGVRAPMAYRLDDLDLGDRTTEVSFVMRRGEVGGWSVVSESADGAGAPPWVVMPDLRVRRGEHAVVAGTVPDSQLSGHVRVVDRAVPDLRRDWSRTPDHVLVLAPSRAQEADALLGRAPGSGVAAVAATTEGPTSADGRATGDRVVLDPTASARLTAVGRDVVLTHELAHVAVRASVAGRAAGWLSEGYADHVGYDRANLPDARLLEPLLAEVRAGRLPADLPRVAELDPGSGAIEVPYLAAWQAVELIADEHGEAALRRLVIAGSATGSEADAETATDRALQRVLDMSRVDLTRAWQQRLRDLAR